MGGCAHAWCEKVAPIDEDWSNQGSGQPVAQVGGEASPWRAQPPYKCEGTLGEGQGVGEVGGEVKGRREPVPELSY